MSVESQVRINFKIETGLPPCEFYGAAWESEPLTRVLEKTDISKVLPFPDVELSLVAKDNDGRVIAQCSANSVTKYWEHVEKVDTTNDNLSTQIFAKIHKLAVAAEREHLREIGELAEHSFHNAGVAVLPEYRGQRIGLALADAQSGVFKTLGKTTFFCETTNCYSAQLLKNYNDFKVVAKYPYADLALSLSHPDLNKIGDDAFTVWCLKV